MNTKRKGTRIRTCDQCPNIYMTVGETAIGLAFPRPPDLDPKNAYMPYHGVCPNHRKVSE